MASARERPAVGVGEAAPSDELHHPLRVEQEDRGAAAAEGVDDQVERRVVDVLERSRAIETIGQRVKRPQLAGFGGAEHVHRRTGTPGLHEGLDPRPRNGRTKLSRMQAESKRFPDRESCPPARLGSRRAKSACEFRAPDSTRPGDRPPSRGVGTPAPVARPPARGSLRGPSPAGPRPRRRRRWSPGGP